METMAITAVNSLGRRGKRKLIDSISCFYASTLLQNNTKIQNADSFVPIGFTPLAAESLKAISSPMEHEVDDLHHFLASQRRILCITGAGISTCSGIPDYRGPGGSYKVAGHKPITHQEFMGLASLSPSGISMTSSSSAGTSSASGEMTRRRYWARALGGYERLKQAKPNDAHHAIHKMIINEKIHCLVTQNVDGLHQKCFSLPMSVPNADASTTTKFDQNILDLHGRIDRVICMKCNHIYSRDYVQELIYSMNPILRDIYQSSDRQEIEKRMRADGDMDLQNLIDYTKIDVPCCERCGDGILKPDVVFFGDNVKKEKVEYIYDQVDEADALMVVGSSLEVFSAYRFVDRANKRRLPIAIINFGQTRAERKGLNNLSFRSESNCAMLLRDAAKKLYC